jgi:hypothetical protein
VIKRPGCEVRGGGEEFAAGVQFSLSFVLSPANARRRGGPPPSASRRPRSPVGAATSLRYYGSDAIREWWTLADGRRNVVQGTRPPSPDPTAGAPTPQGAVAAVARSRGCRGRLPPTYVFLPPRGGGAVLPAYVTKHKPVGPERQARSSSSHTGLGTLADHSQCTRTHAPVERVVAPPPRTPHTRAPNAGLAAPACCGTRNTTVSARTSTPIIAGSITTGSLAAALVAAPLFAALAAGAWTRK